MDREWRSPIQAEFEIVARRTLGATAVGASWACALALLRGQSLVRYAVPMGTNFFVTSGLYFGACAAAAHARRAAPQAQRRGAARGPPLCFLTLTNAP